MRDRRRPYIGLNVQAVLAAGLLGAVALVAGCGSGKSSNATGGAGGGGPSPMVTISATGTAKSPTPAGTSSPTAAPTGPASVTTASTKLGPIVVDESGRTLYVFEKDPPNVSECTGACATEWPSFSSHGMPKAGHGAEAALVGTIKRSDNTTQVTYNKHPLYYYRGDAGKPGEIKGQNVSAFGAKWHVIAPNGNKVTGTGS